MTWNTCDLSDEHGDAACHISSLRHYGDRTRFSGPLETVQCYEDNSRIKELANTPGHGRVLLVDGGGSLRCALVGDTIGGELIANGWVGIVVRGAIRDTAALATMEIGVLALGTHPRKSARVGQGLAGVQIEIDGERFAPGDVLYADEDGIVVLPAAG
jgi:regulator of ribonuclease activity A